MSEISHAHKDETSQAIKMPFYGMPLLGSFLYILVVGGWGYWERVQEKANWVAISWTFIFAIFGASFLWACLHETRKKMAQKSDFGRVGLVALLLLSIFYAVLVVAISWV